MTQIPLQISLNTSRYALLLLAVVVGLLGMHTVLYVINYTVGELPWLLLQLFDLDEEYNLPTWFSSFLLLNNAFILFMISQGPTTSHRTHWRVLASGFLLLSIDEVAGLHETLNTAIEMNWAIPGGIVAAIVGIAFLPFLLALPRKRALLFVTSGIVYVLGAVIIELLSEDMDSDTLGYMLAVAVEEGCEMLGAWLFLAVNLHSLRQSADAV